MSAPRPLREHLASPTDEARISRMWRVIRARRAERARSPAWIAVPAALAAALVAGWLAWPVAAPAPEVGWAVPDRFEAAAPRRFELPDGSSVELDADARLTTIENDPARFVTLLERGAASFEVRPGGPRRWVIECGLATVEVVGTALRIERRLDEVAVHVTRGAVLVRGERVPDRVARLGAGDSLLVRAAPPAPLPSLPEALDEALAAPEPPVRSAPHARIAARRATAGERRRRGEPRSWVRALLDRASEAQRAGEYERAAALLGRAAATDDPRAALAAYTLGRLEMDELRRPARARSALRRALALGLPERIAQQARQRLADLSR
ncbi:MAG: FecR domain-containing protein [Sandaracinaceae bacterium]|nr:FecR domain-containing protein [Sandaracinaceae bacterium]